MANSIYQVNKGVNRSIEFKGLKAQYILYAAIGFLCLLLIYVALYLIGVSNYLCIGIILLLGSLLVVKVYAMNNKYGEFGMMKELARRRLPKTVKCKSRKIFYLEREKR